MILSTEFEEQGHCVSHLPLDWDLRGYLIYNALLIYIKMNWRYFRRFKDVDYKYTWVVYIIMASILLGMSYTNFGLTIRQKSMVIPPLVLVFMMVRSQKAREEMEEMQEVAEEEETSPPAISPY